MITVMSGEVIHIGPAFAVVVALLAITGTVVVRGGGIGTGWPVLTAATRAVLQLGLVSLLIVAVIRSGWLTALFVLMMFTVAALTSARRISQVRSAGWAAVAIAGGAAPVLALVLTSQVLPARPITVVPIAGIVIGGTMTASSLAGRRALDELHTRYGEYEAALALGLRVRDAALEVCRPSAWQALVPALDQTRTVGLVTLPGAFVGALLGGASPLQAGAAQLLILVGLVASESIAVLVVVELVARGRIRRTTADDGVTRAGVAR